MWFASLVFNVPLFLMLLFLFKGGGGVASSFVTAMFKHLSKATSVAEAANQE
jgi:hypothetical protein